MSAATSVLLCAVAGGRHARVLQEDVDYRIVRGDIQVPIGEADLRRRAHIEGSLLISGISSAWLNGTVPWRIDSTSDPRNTGSPLSSSDSRFAAAAAVIEAKTCIRMPRCANDDCSSVTTGYVSFTKSDSNNSPLGRSFFNNPIRNQINIGDGCGVSCVVHEIGHSLGLDHEHQRPDRDSHVTVNLAAVQAEGLCANSCSSGSQCGGCAAGRCPDTGAGGLSCLIDQFQLETGAQMLTPYDYKSIMHYGAFYFAASSTTATIVAPEAIGASAMSANDAFSIDFLHNSCRDSYPSGPRCTVSVDNSARRTIPHSQAFAVQFNAMYSQSLTISYGSTTATGAAPNPGTGTNAGVLAKATLTYTPQPSEAGQDKDLAVTFTAGDGRATTCTVQVKVAGSSTVCFGIPGDDPSVCSGQGTCTANTATPCTCNSGRGGRDCSGFADCPANTLYGFDNSADPAPLHFQSDTTYDSTFYAQGGGSLSVRGQVHVRTTQPQKPGRVTFYLARSAGREPQLTFRATDNGESCFFVSARSGRWASRQGTTSVSANAGQFYFMDMRMDWSTMRVSLHIDGQFQHTEDINSVCSGGYTIAVLFASDDCGLTASAPCATPTHLDEFHVWCTRYMVPSGALASGLEQATLRSGGATLTLTLVGEEWASFGDSEKAMLAENIVSLYPTPQGWNAQKNTMFGASQVQRVSSTVVTVGALNAAASYTSLANERVRVSVNSSLLANGRAPAWSEDEGGFTVPGLCDSSITYNFDDSAAVSSYVSSGAVQIDTTNKQAGAGSMKIVRNGNDASPSGVVTLSAGNTRPSQITYYARVTDTAGQATVKLRYRASPGASELDGPSFLLGFNGAAAIGRAANGGVATDFGSISAGTFTKMELKFTWSSPSGSDSVALHLAGSSSAGGSITLPSAMTSVSSLVLFGFDQPNWFDEMMLECTQRPPVFNSQPACPIPGATGVVLSFQSGTLSLSTSDTAALTADSSGCSNLVAESTAQEIYAGEGDVVNWAASRAVGLLQALTTYGVCYKRSGGSYERLGATLTTCPGSPTSSPSTAPPTAAPTRTPTSPTASPQVAPKPPIPVAEIPTASAAQTALNTLTAVAGVPITSVTVTAVSTAKQTHRMNFNGDIAIATTSFFNSVRETVAAKLSVAQTQIKNMVAAAGSFVVTYDVEDVSTSSPTGGPTTTAGGRQVSGAAAVAPILAAVLVSAVWAVAA